nr:DUF29 domain-containing protein [Thiocystis violacea]
MPPDQDRHAWAMESARMLRTGQMSELNLGRIAEELEDRGRSEKQALSSHLKVLVLHLLKWRYQPAFRGLSWKLSITHARDEVMELLEDSPSLRATLPELLMRRYPAARRRAILETGLREETFPRASPFTLDQLLDADDWT